jgi:predicted DNA-binding antitoxin AbrB/MazE fold protein
MTMTVQAVFENGVLRPLSPLGLPEGRRVEVIVTEGSGESPDATEAEVDSRKAEDLSDEEYEALLDSLSEGLDLPILPPSAYSRESFYEDD